MIATLNASHPDYDFSHVLRPGDFKRERNLRQAMSNIDSTLNSVRPNPVFHDATEFPPGLAATLSWGPQMWALVDKEMSLKDCTVFSYQPADDPFEEDKGAIWSLHYFFFNKALKRVCYIYVRGVPVISHHSPSLRASAISRMAGSSDLSTSAKRRAAHGLMSSAANKRARFWLGDRAGERIAVSDDEMDDDDLEWNRGSDGDLKSSYDDWDDDDEMESVTLDDEYDEYEADSDDDDQMSKSPVRGVSEDIASRMELEA